MELSERIQTLRKRRGLSQEELAAAIGVSRQSVSKWESGQNLPDLEKLISLGDYFDVSTDYLLRGIDEERPAERTESARARRCFLASTALNAAALIAAVAIWDL